MKTQEQRSLDGLIWELRYFLSNHSQLLSSEDRDKLYNARSVLLKYLDEEK